jgi:hypothetical protein
MATTQMMRCVICHPESSIYDWFTPTSSFQITTCHRKELVQYNPLYGRTDMKKTLCAWTFCKVDVVQGCVKELENGDFGGQQRRRRQLHNNHKKQFEEKLPRKRRPCITKVHRRFSLVYWQTFHNNV